MATGPTFPASAILDLVSFRQDSEQLQEFLTRDFSSMLSEITSLFQHQRPPLRFVPLVWRLARDLAPLYVRKPDRSFTGVSPTVAEQMARVYQRAHFDTLMRSCSRQAVVHNTQVVSVDPVGPEDVAVRAWSPFELDVEFDDPLEEDIRRAKMVRLRIPLTWDDGRVEYGSRVYTQTMAYTTRCDDDGNDVPIAGIFNDDMTNPFNGIPLRAYRRETAIKGFWFPPIAQDMLAVQIGINLVLSFVEHVGRHQGFTQTTLTGSGAKTAAENMYAGPNYVLAMDGDDMTLDVHDPSPPTDKTLDALDTTLRLFGASNYVDVQSLLSKSTGITGDAKAMERQDQEEARRELELDFQQFEADIAGLVLEAMRLKGLPRGDEGAVGVDIDYRYVEPARNDLQTVQAQEARFLLGLDARTKVIAREQGMSLDDAADVLRSNLEESAKVLMAQAEVLQSRATTSASEGDNNVPGM